MKRKLILMAGVGTLFVAVSKEIIHAADEDAPRVEPILTLSAQTAPKITLKATFNYFNGVELQEADRFDGYTVSGELIVPFLQRFQLRLFHPFYTDGRARLADPGNPANGMRISIHGPGGVFDFTSANLDYQFIKGEQPGDWNFAASAGMGRAFHPLKTTDPNLIPPGTFDLYNHAGASVLFSISANGDIGKDWSLFANLGGRYYYESDDLNPGNTSTSGDTFFLLDARTAVTYNSFSKYFVPAAELVYQGDASGYNSVSFVPEFIILPCAHFQLKAGFPIGIADGQRWGATVQAAFSF